MSSLLIENKKVIIASGRNPFHLSTISERIKSRFKEGFITQLGYPDYESRVKFLSSGIFNSDLELSDEIIKIIAQNINSFGALKGFINELEIMHALGVVLSQEQVELVIKNYIQPVNL